ncbi:hypothetical protein [Paludisphaera soli]|uniref:hypothetical protein n=1 Tax=Paludisphaera soli TaxID=2712865 RepID=UPI0013EDA618|nr:hypothetical protein [Paludisphaera soli]
MATPTPKLKLFVPDFDERDWHLIVNAGIEAVEALTSLTSLHVTSHEVPSTTLSVDVAPGVYEKQDGTFGTYAGETGVAIPASSTRYLWLNSSGVLTQGAAWPSTAMIRLAVVVSGATTITSVSDARTPFRVAGMGTAAWLPLAGGTLDDGADIAVGTGSGTMIGTATGQKLGFYGAAPVVQQGPFTTSYATETMSRSGYTASPMTSAFTGIADGQGGTPYAQASDLNSLRAAVENLRLAFENDMQYLNGLIAKLKLVGYIK